MAIHIFSEEYLSRACMGIIDLLRPLPPGQNKAVISALANLDALLESALACAWDRCIRATDGGGIRPTVRFYRRSGAIAELILPSLDEEDLSQIRLAANVAGILLEAEVDGYFVISEAWVAKSSADPEVAKLRPRQRSDRQEVLFVSAGLAGRHTLRLYPMIRGADAKLTGFGDAETLSGNLHPMMLNLYAIADGLA